MELLLDSFDRRRMVKCWLFMCIFVVHIQADDCPRPQGTANTVLTDEALLKNDFPEGSEARFKCANGYVIETGSGVVTCTGGQWTALDLVCKKKDCGPPEQQPHMTFDISEAEGTLFGATVKVICEKGFEISGVNYKQCYASGWGGRTKCEVIICDVPTYVTHGRHSWISDEEPEYGNVIQYSCDDGYTLVGNSSITCSDDSEYDSLPPQCQGNIELSTKDMTTTTRMTSTTPPTFQDTSVTPTIPKVKTTTTTATSTASPSIQGGKHILPTDVITTTTGATSATTTQGKILPNQDSGYTVVIASVISTVLVVLLCCYMLHRFLLRRKGSYCTGEDLKPELLQCQSL